MGCITLMFRFYSGYQKLMAWSYEIDKNRKVWK